jgi:hypothetical protein
MFILNFENMKKQDILEILNGAAVGYLVANTSLQWYHFLAGVICFITFIFYGNNNNKN